MDPIPEANRRITEEEIVALLTFSIEQLGGSLVVDGFDWRRLIESNKTVQLLTQADPWRLIVKVVDKE